MITAFETQPRSAAVQVTAAEAAGKQVVLVNPILKDVAACHAHSVYAVQVTAAEAAGKQVVLVNPILKDVPSAGGIMGVSGRDQRLLLADSFVTAYHLRLLYFSGSFYPIVGALRFATGGTWQVRFCAAPVFTTRSAETRLVSVPYHR